LLIIGNYNLNIIVIMSGKINLDDIFKNDLNTHRNNGNENFMIYQINKEASKKKKIPAK